MALDPYSALKNLSFLCFVYWDSIQAHDCYRTTEKEKNKKTKNHYCANCGTTYFSGEVPFKLLGSMETLWKLSTKVDHMSLKEPVNMCLIVAVLEIFNETEEAHNLKWCRGWRCPHNNDFLDWVCLSPDTHAQGHFLFPKSDYLL